MHRFLLGVLCAAAVSSVYSAPARMNRLLPTNCRIVTLVEGQEEPFTGYIVVGSGGLITQIGHGAAPQELKAESVIDAEGRVAAPGFVSARTPGTTQPLGAEHAGVTTWAVLTAGTAVWSPLSDGRQGAPISVELKKTTVAMGVGNSRRDLADPFENMRFGLKGMFHCIDGFLFKP